MRAIELATFGAIATGLHVAAAVQWNTVGSGETRPAPAGTVEVVAVAAANATLRDLVAEWEEPPHANEVVARILPTAVALPELDRTMKVPAERSPKPEIPALGAPPEAPGVVVAQPERTSLVRPRERPADLRVRRAAPSEPVTASRGSAGRTAAPASPSGVGGDDAALEAAHAGAVRDALAKARSYPAQARDRGISGRPVLQIDLDRSGRLLAAALARSSGSEILDRASLEAAHRAQFPAAPAALDRQSFSYRVGVSYALD